MTLFLLSFGAYFALFGVLGTLAFVDAKHLVLPDRLMVFFGILTLLLKGIDALFLSFYGIFTLLGISLGLKKGYFWRTQREGLGWGDVKFLTLSGLWIPFEQIPFFLIAIGGIGCGGSVCWKRLGKGDAFPLGSVIASVLSVCIWYQGIK